MQVNNRKKRNSVCLETTGPLLEEFKDLPRKESFYGNDRKTRRYSISHDPSMVGNCSISESDGRISYLHGNGGGRRSSVTLPKSNWPEEQPISLVQYSEFQPIEYSEEKCFNFDIPLIKCEEEKEEMGKYYLDDINLIGLLKESKPMVEKNTCRKGPWTKEEDEMLIQLAGADQNKNKNWTEIAEQIRIRTPKQCRERWCFNLDPSIKKEVWTVDEDLLIIRRQSVIGNKWAQIAQLLQGRTENAVKTRYKSIMRAKKREWKTHEDLLLLELFQRFGVNWQVIAGHLEPHRTKHAVKIRIKALQQGLILMSDPELGSARLTVRLMFYPKESLKQVSLYYQRLANGEVEVQQTLKEEVIPKKEIITGYSTSNIEEYGTFEESFYNFLGEEDLILV